MTLSDQLLEEAECALAAGAKSHEMGLDPSPLGNWYEGGASAFRHAASLARDFETKLTRSASLDSVAVESVDSESGRRVLLVMHSSNLAGGFRMNLPAAEAKKVAAAIFEAADEMTHDPEELQ